MYRMNQKAQTFSTFKLLISAIVAIALLTIMFNIMGLIPSLGQQDPQTKAIDLIKEATNPEYTTQKAKVQFSAGNSISATAIENQGIGYEVCVSPGDTGFGGTPGATVQYETGPAKNVTLYAMCGSLDQLLLELDTVSFPVYDPCPNTDTNPDESVCILTISKSAK